VRIDGRPYRALVADSFIKRAIGLMFRKSMDKDTCMLFVSKRDRRESLTMHNMLFSIDVLWLDRDLRIVNMMENLPPDKGFSFKTYTPKSRARYVLELKSGSIRKNRITKKSEIKIGKEIREK
jgi:hypothetical protein